MEISGNAICCKCHRTIRGGEDAYGKYDKNGALYVYCSTCAKKNYKIDVRAKCCKCGSVDTSYVHNGKMYCESCLRKLRQQTRFWNEEKQWEILDAMLDIVED